MIRLIGSGEVELPCCVREATQDHYARRELYQSAKHGYSVIAMTWGPGQGTPIHDHSGLWCVEGVWHGTLEITPYDLIEEEGNRCRFRAAKAIHAGTGSAGSLIPPHEYHTIRNPAAEGAAVSLHVYEGVMQCCSVFEAAEDGWHRRGKRQLCLDRVD